MKHFKKLMSVLLMIAMLVTSTISVFADAAILEQISEEELRTAARGSDEDVAAYPNGKFEFLATQMTTSEDISVAEITVMRKAGTQGEATVTFKAVDISAEYGKDYIIKVPKGIINSTLEKNNEAKPLIESFTVEEDSEAESDNDENADLTDDLSLESVTSEESSEIAEEVSEELTLTDINESTEKTSELAKAFENSVGKKAAKKDWRRSTAEESAEAKKTNDEFFNEALGVTYDLEFADGEFMKKLYFCTIDDDISESDEQVILTLVNPTAGELGELSSAYMNIQDNEEYEKPQFAVQNSVVEVKKGVSVAKITLVRTAGLYHYANVIAATAGITAKEGVDYKATTEELIFVPGVSSKTVEVPILNNEASEEGDKTFSVIFGEQSDGGFNKELSALVIIRNDGNGGNIAAVPEKMKLLGNSEFLPMNVGGGRVDNYTGYNFTNRANGGGSYNYNDNGTYRIRLNNQNGSAEAAIYADLYGIEKISFQWENSSNGRYWENKNSCGKVTSSGYSQCFGVYAGIEGTGDKLSRGQKFAWETREFALTDADRTKSYVYFKTKNWAPDQSRLNVFNIKFHYKDYKIELGNNLYDEGDDAFIKPLKYTSATTAEPNGDDIYIGSMKVSGTSNIYNYGDTIYFEPTYSTGFDTSKVYLWGFKVENQGGYYTKSIKGTSLKLDKATLSDLKNNSCLLNNADTIKVKPIFKQRISYVQLNFNSSISGITGFNNGDVIKLNAFDTISINGYANAPKYASGYTATCYNGALTSGYNDETTLYNIMQSTVKTHINNGTIPPWYFGQFDISSQINLVTPGVLDYKPTYRFEKLTMLYGDPELNVKSDPTQKDTSYKNRGEVGVESFSGRFGTPILISPSVMDKTYQIIAVPADNYKVIWRDFTGDVDNDGELSSEEKKALENTTLTSAPVLGNTFYYRPVMPVSKIYYTFEPKGTDTTKRKIYGNVVLQGGTVLNKSSRKTPIEGASVSIGNDTVYTDEDGYFISESTDYNWEDIYSVKINYNGYDFISRAEVGASGQHTISAFETLMPDNFKMFRNGNQVQPYEVDNGESTYRFEFTTTSTAPTVSAASAKLRIYSKDAALKKEYVITSTTNKFECTIIPKNEGVSPGDYMTLQLFDNNEKAYFENEVGFSFVQNIDTFSFIQSFKNPVRPVLDFLGKIDLMADLGVAGKVKDYFTVTEKGMTMSFGFSKDYETEYDSSEKKQEDGREVAKTNSPNAQKAKTNKAVDKENGKNTKKSKITANMSFGFSVAVSVVMERSTKGADIGKFYFKNLLVYGVVTSSVKAKYEYMTPIGIPVFVTGSLSGTITSAMVIEQYDNKRFYFDGEGGINFANAGVNNTSRDFTIYGKFFINPTVTIGVGVGYSFLNVELEGCAAFSLNFTTLGTGDGSVVLSATIKVKILFITKSWKVAEKEFELFNYGSKSMLSLFGDENYLYDGIDTFEQMPRDYLSNRGNWNGAVSNSSDMRLFGASDGYSETSLLSGAYPMPGSQMIKYGDKILLVFIDDDINRTEENRTILKYSIFSGEWSEPLAVEDDGTLDAEPNLFDLGDKVLLTWSDGEEILPQGADAIETLSNLNISGAFFDKASGTFGSVTQITKTTDGDYCSDGMPKTAYDEVSGKLILYYTKTEYDPPTEGEGTENEKTKALVGDVLNGYSVIAYTFFDSNTNEWKKTYTAEEKAKIMANSKSMTEDEFAIYQDNWYGQQFLDLAPSVVVNESEIMDNDGRWKDGATPTVTKYGSTATENVEILESSSISYNQLSLFAYVADFDGDKSTSNDQAVYLQIYDFSENIFTHPIQITNDNNKNSNLRFIRNNNETYLYWISGGDIKYTNVSGIVKTGLCKQTIDSTDFYILDKSKNSGYDGTITVAEQKENNPYSEFEVKTDDSNNIYLVWPEIITTYKNGIDPASEAATLAENQLRETQIFISRFSYDMVEQEIQIYDDNGNEMVYPENDNEGNPINYSDAKGINGETVKAGDPVIYRSDMPVGGWSKPVQYTNEAGANLTELDFVILDNGNLRAVYNKSYSTVTDDGFIANDSNSCVLTTADFIPASNVVINADDISLSDNVVQANSTNVITAKITNDGLQTFKGYSAKIYQVTDGIETLLDEKVLDGVMLTGFIGGDTIEVSALWEVPSSLDNLSVRVDVENASGMVIASATKDVAYKEIIEISDFKAEIAKVDTATVMIDVTNTGNKHVTNTPVTIYTDGIEKDSAIVDLEIGESKQLRFVADVAGKFVASKDDDGNAVEKAEIQAKTNDCSQSIYVEKTATAEEIALIKNLKRAEISQSKKSIEVGEEEKLSLSGISPETRAQLDVIWESSDESVAMVSGNGIVTATGNGNAAISATVFPKGNLHYANNLTDSIYLTGFETKASEAVKVLQTNIEVKPDKTDKPDKTKGSLGKSGVPAGNSVFLAPKVFGAKKILLLAHSLGENENPDYLVLVDKQGNVIKNSYYNQATGQIVALVDDLNAGYEIKSININFDDVSGEWYEKPVKFLAARNIINGVEKGRFDSESDITRADFVVLLTRLFDLSGDTSFSFDDVDVNSYYANAVSAAKQNGIVFGGDDGKFNPNDVISRQDMFTIAHRILAKFGITSSAASTEVFSDDEYIADYAKDSIIFLKGINLINGYNGAINPNANSKRSETAQFIYNIYNYIIVQ